MDIALILARSRHGVIGLDGKIPWKQKEDMKFFKNMTTGHICIYGRNTFESMGYRPLRNRANIVISSQGELLREKVGPSDWETPLMFVPTLEAALCSALIFRHRTQFYVSNVFLCGGKRVYEEGLMYADRAYVTEVDSHLKTGVTVDLDFTGFTPIVRGEKPEDAENWFPTKFVEYVREEIE